MLADGALMWCLTIEQVASKYMPMSSLLVGVDLDRIQPIKNAITLQEDITTARCRKELRRVLTTWDADV